MICRAARRQQTGWPGTRCVVLKRWGLMNRFEDEEFPPAGNLPARKPKTFEDLTLAQALSYLVLRPRAAARQLWRVLTYDPDAVVMDEPDVIDWPDDDQEPPADAADDDWPGEYDSLAIRLRRPQIWIDGCGSGRWRWRCCWRCAAVTFCSGRRWIRCDMRRAIRAVRCGGFCWRVWC